MAFVLYQKGSLNPSPPIESPSLLATKDTFEAYVIYHGIYLGDFERSCRPSQAMPMEQLEGFIFSIGTEGAIGNYRYYKNKFGSILCLCR
jgi:hypothetical protein